MTRTTTLAGLAERTCPLPVDSLSPTATLTPSPRAELLLSVYDALLDRYMPPLILIDQARQVVDTFSDADQFLRFGSRRPSQDVVDLLLEPLRQPIADALEQCFRTRQDVLTEAISLLPTWHNEPLAAAGCPQTIFARVAPIAHGQDDSLFFSITLETADRQTVDPKQLIASSPWREATTPAVLPPDAPHPAAAPPWDQFLEAANLAVVFLDAELQIRHFSAQAGQLFGLLPHDVGRHMQTFIGPLGKTDLLERIRQVAHTGDPDSFEIHQACSQRFYVVQLTPWSDSADRDGVIVTLLDLSALEAERRQASRHSRIVQSSTDAIISRDCDGKIVTWNAAAEELYGYSASEAIGQPIDLIVPQDEADEQQNVLRVLRRDKPIQQLDVSRVTKAGQRIRVSTRLSPIYDEDHQIIGLASIERDISLRLQMIERMAQSDRMLQAFYSHSPEMSCAFDMATSTVTDCNEPMCRQLGWTREQIIGRSLLDLLDESGRDHAVACLERFGRTGMLHDEEFELRRCDGSLLPTSLSATAIYDTHGRVIGGRGMWRDNSALRLKDELSRLSEDIALRRELEGELRSAIEQRDQFLAMLSHELRNPLGAILNTCAVLSRRKVFSKYVQNAVLVVTRQARQMAELLDDLLDVSRITTGKIKLEKAPTELSEIVDQAVESQQSLATSRGQRVTVTYCDEPLRVFGDASRLVQVVVNLLNNAIKYTGDGGSIAVTLEKQGRIGRIRVRDNGVGLEPEQIESLFEMFAQKDATLDRSGGGMGLGLHLVRKLVNFHSGKVIGRSDGLGKGSEFIVELPLSTRKAAGAKAAGSYRAKKKPRIKKIAVIEDIADAREMLVALLEADDYIVTSAADGEAGLALILQERPDLAIVDIGLPKLDGYEVARRVRQQIPASELRLVALTGYGQDSDHDQVMAAGFDTHLVKPLNHTRLEKILAGRR